MSCDVSTPPFPCHRMGSGNPFDDKSLENEHDDLSAIAEYNNSFQGFDQHSVEPHLRFSNVKSPSYNLDQTLSPDASPNLYPDFVSTPLSPYFQSIEPTSIPFVPSPLRNQCVQRRSVSEPPNDAMMQLHRAHLDQPVTFHRDGHRLGVPQTKSSYASPSKKAKHNRTQPYKSAQHPPSATQSRYQLRRAYTQPSNRCPTSTPMGTITHPPLPQPPLSHPATNAQFDSMPEELQYVSSRVCTPAPEAVDSMLATAHVPMTPQMGTNAQVGHLQPGKSLPIANALVIKMGVDELRLLVQEAVQKAVEGLKDGKLSTNAVLNADVGDNIVFPEKLDGNPQGKEGHVRED